MENSKSKIFAQFIAGIFGGTILGIPSFVNMMNYGGNYGGSYESYGTIGAISGVIIGTILTTYPINNTIFESMVSNIKVSNYSRVAIWLLLGTFLLPFLYGVIMFWPPFEDGDLLIVPPVILIFMLFSTISSLLITGAINWRKFLRLKR